MQKGISQRERAQFDVLQRILDERLKRGWTEYALAKNSGMTQSTISTWYRMGYDPTIASIEKLCSGFGMTLSQFFLDEPIENGLNEEQKQLMLSFERLTPDQRSVILALLASFHEGEE